MLTRPNYYFVDAVSADDTETAVVELQQNPCETVMFRQTNPNFDNGEGNAAAYYFNYNDYRNILLTTISYVLLILYTIRAYTYR